MEVESLLCGSHEILQRVGNVSFESKLPSELASVHLVFHVCMLKKCISDPEFILLIESIGVKDNLSYKVVSVQIFHRQVKKFRNKEVAFVKAETDMKSRYTHQFGN